MRIGQYNYDGVVFNTLVFDDAESANAFMMFDSEWGVISKRDSAQIHLARIDDKGTRHAEKTTV